MCFRLKKSLQSQVQMSLYFVSIPASGQAGDAYCGSRNQTPYLDLEHLDLLPTRSPFVTLSSFMMKYDEVFRNKQKKTNAYFSRKGFQFYL